MSTTNDLASLAVHSITFTGSGYTLAGNGIDLYGDVTSRGPAGSDNAIAFPITLRSAGNGAPFAVSVADASASLRLNGWLQNVPGGARVLVKTGLGRLVINGEYRDALTAQVIAGAAQINSSSQNSSWDVGPGAVIEGSGTIKWLTVRGGTVRPGTSDTPHELRAETMRFLEGATLAVRVRSADAGGLHDWILSDTVFLGAARLAVHVESPPSRYQAFRLVYGFRPPFYDGMLQGLPNNAVFTADGYRFRVTYDTPGIYVTALGTASGVPTPYATAAVTWTGAVDRNWSNPGNWLGGPLSRYPSPDLIFPAGAVNLNPVNDLTGLGVNSITILGNGYTVSGNPLHLYGGIQDTAGAGSRVTISLGLEFYNVDSRSVPVEVSDPEAALKLTGPIDQSELYGFRKWGPGSLVVEAVVGDDWNPIPIYVDDGPLIMLGGPTFGGRFLADRVFVGPGATLWCHGTVGGVASRGGTIHPGSPEVAGNLRAVEYFGPPPLQLDAASTYAVRLNGPPQASEYDWIFASAYGDGKQPPTDLASARLDVSFGYLPAPNQSFTILHSTALHSDVGVVGTFAGLPDGAVFTANGMRFRINYTSYDVILTALGMASVSDAYSQAVLRDDPVVYWRLDEPRGTIAFDQSGHGNYGTYTGGVTYDQPGAIGGTADTGVRLDGSSGYIAAPNTASETPSNALSVEAWVKLDAYTGSYPRIVSKAGSYELSLYTFSGGEGRLEWKLFTPTESNARTAYADRLLLGQWYHVVGTYDGSAAKIFVNGVQRAAQPVSGTVALASSALSVGRTDRLLAASVDEAAVYPTALSGDQVRSHFAAARSGNTTGTPSPTASATATPTPTPTVTPIRTPTATLTATRTATTTPNATRTPTGTPTSSVAPPVTSLYEQTVLADHPAGYWRLGESSGPTAVDSSGHGNHGAYVGGVTLGRPGALTGDADTAARLDGASGYVTVVNSPSLNPSAAVSVEGWVKLDAYSGSYPRLVSKIGSFELTMYTYTGGEGRLEWTIFTSTARSVTTTYADRLQTGQWYHVAATYDGAAARIYLNGTLKASLATSGPLTTTANRVTLGRSDRFLAATLDEVAVYPTALSADQIARHVTLAAQPAATVRHAAPDIASSVKVE